MLCACAWVCTRLDDVFGVILAVMIRDKDARFGVRVDGGVEEDVLTPRVGNKLVRSSRGYLRVKGCKLVIVIY